MDKLILPSFFLAAFVTAFVGACAQPIAVSTELPCPDPLVIPKATPDIKTRITTMKSEDPELYEFFLRRSKLQAARRDRLQNLCRSTHG